MQILFIILGLLLASLAILGLALLFAIAEHKPVYKYIKQYLVIDVVVISLVLLLVLGTVATGKEISKNDCNWRIENGPYTSEIY